MVIGLFAGLAIAAESTGIADEGTAKEVRKSTIQDVMPSQKSESTRTGIPASVKRGSLGPLDPQQRRLEMLKRQAEVHKQAIGELEEIKKIAQEEDAVRTVEAIQKMIDKKNEEHKKRIESLNRTQQDRAEQIRKRSGKADSTSSEKKVKIEMAADSQDQSTE